MRKAVACLIVGCVVVAVLAIMWSMYAPAVARAQRKRRLDPRRVKRLPFDKRFLLFEDDVLEDPVHAVTSHCSRDMRMTLWPVTVETTEGRRTYRAENPIVSAFAYISPNRRGAQVFYMDEDPGGDTKQRMLERGYAHVTLTSTTPFTFREAE
jgi:hypothetical protein